MKIDAASAVALKAVIEDNLAALDRYEQALAELFARHPNEHEIIAIGYHLHNLYNALENSFEQASRSFENHVVDKSRWHQELLGKMFLDLTPLRPALLPATARAFLVKLCSYRHFFRHSYGCELEFEELQALWNRWSHHGPQIKASLRQFGQSLGAEGTRGSP